MSLRLDHDDPEAMSPEERRDEVASILARGVLRLQGRIVGDCSKQNNLPEFASTRLDLSAPPRPCGQSLPGDINNDGQVNFADLNLVLADFGQSCG